MNGYLFLGIFGGIVKFDLFNILDSIDYVYFVWLLKIELFDVDGIKKVLFVI